MLFFSAIRVDAEAWTLALPGHFIAQGAIGPAAGPGGQNHYRRRRCATVQLGKVVVGVRAHQLR